MEEAGLTHRAGYQHEDYGIEDLDDINYADSDSGSDYGADNEDNDEFPEEKANVQDPGPFRYNKKMVVVSLPCAVMVLTLVGEM